MASAPPATFLLKVGDVEIYRVEELVLPTSVRWLLPDIQRPEVEPTKEWLQPHFMDDAGYLLQSIHTYVLKMPGHTILIDTGVGNNKERTGGIPEFNMLDTPFLERLASLDVKPGDVDMVLCTHMHGDHVGWNTQLVDDKWVPAFPNARYLFAEPEYKYWTNVEPGASPRPLIVDSVQPVADAGLVDLVPVDHQVTPEIRLEPSHGHTPGHVSIRIDSQGQSAVLIGDVMHSPIQCAFPTHTAQLGGASQASKDARVAVLEKYADTGIPVFGAHFHAPCAGLVRRDGEAFRFEGLGS